MASLRESRNEPSGYITRDFYYSAPSLVVVTGLESLLHEDVFMTGWLSLEHVCNHIDYHSSDSLFILPRI
jgi:hypothetical protein